MKEQIKQWNLTGKPEARQKYSCVTPCLIPSNDNMQY